MTPPKGPKGLPRQCNLLSGQSQSLPSYLSKVKREKIVFSWWPLTATNASAIQPFEKYTHIYSFHKRTLTWLPGTQSFFTSNKKSQPKDCYHTSSAHLLHLHFICCAIIPRPAPLYDPSCLSAPPPFCLFTRSSRRTGRQGLWAPESVPHQGVSFFAFTKTTPTYPLRGEENFLVEEEQLQMKQTMLTQAASLSSGSGAF